MNLLLSFRSEILKTKRTATLYFTIILAALVPLIFLLDVCIDGVSQDNRVDPLNAIIREGFGFLYILIFPMYIILVCTLLPQIEYRNNTWKQVFASPQPMINIFIARFLNVHLLIIVFLLLYNVLMAVVMVATHFIDPALNLLNQPMNWSAWTTWNLNAYLAVLAISALQFWMGLRFRNFIVPLAAGFALWLTGTIMVMQLQMPNAHYFPYTYLPFSAFSKYKDLVPAIQWGSVAYMVAFLGLGFVDFRRMGK
jgi:hypothetical protein